MSTHVLCHPSNFQMNIFINKNYVTEVTRFNAEGVEEGTYNLTIFAARSEYATLRAQGWLKPEERHAQDWGKKEETETSPKEENKEEIDMDF